MWLYGCLDDQTLVLTRRGWLQHTELQMTDELLQWDSLTGTLTWTMPTEIIIKPYSGKMVNIQNRHTNQLLTPNHRVYARLKSHSRYSWPNTYQVLQAREFVGRSTAWNLAIPLAGTLEGKKTVDTDWAYLVGWWLTDAWKHGDGKACMFSQCKPKTLDKLRKCLEPYGPSEYLKKSKKEKHKDEHTFYVTGSVAERLLAEHPERKVTWQMLDWSLSARLRLLEGLLDGDGTQPDNDRQVKQGEEAYPTHCKVFWSQNSERRAIVLALMVSVGWRAYDYPNKGCVYCNSKTTETQLSAKHRSICVDYEGDVWCVRVPKQAFVVMRDGKPFITGNSGFPKSADVGKMIDKAKGATREVIGTKMGLPGYTLSPNAGGASYNQGVSGHTSEERIKTVEITAPATDLAKLWTGWTLALKPAWEPIILAMKPMDGTIAQNAEEWGVAGMNIDACRIGPCPGYKYNADRNGTTFHGKQGERIKRSAAKKGAATIEATKGRWPANVLLDEIQTEILVLKGGLPDEIVRVIKEYYGYCSQVSNLREEDTDVAQSGEKRTREILQPEVLCSTPESESARGEPSDVWQKAHVRVDSQDAESQTEDCEAREREPVLQGVSLQSRLPLHKSRLVIDGATGDSGEDGEQESTLRSRTPAESSSAAGSATDKERDSTPSKRRKGRQPNTKPSTNRGSLPQNDAPSVAPNSSTAATRERSFEVPACKVPEQWKKYFEATGKVTRDPACSAFMLDEQSGYSKSSAKPRNNGDFKSPSKGAEKAHVTHGHEDEGGASRFFYCAKSSKREKGADNDHPTVKPLTLMDYLLKLLSTPTGGVILDPFAGSGTTLVAAKRQGRTCIGVELTDHNCDIAIERLNRTEPEQ